MACMLDEAEITERRRTLLELVRSAVFKETSLPLGYAYHFQPTSEIVALLSRLVDLERQCCPFLTFKITVEAGNQPICLEVTGPDGAKALIAEFFGPSRQAGPPSLAEKGGYFF